MNIREAIEIYCLKRNLLLLDINTKEGLDFTVRNPNHRHAKFQINLGFGIRVDTLTEEAWTFSITDENLFKETYI